MRRQDLQRQDAASAPPSRSAWRPTAYAMVVNKAGNAAAVAFLAGPDGGWNNHQTLRAHDGMV
ncbi:MAG: hypothetical protein JWQ90_3290 [Hydrocarboniphaga sp.]|nr:hypothetical protein [Hydrocarboniphaga sp.]MDB5970840.1 hypothetical protein [Hydrocarboniphaga sp.]